MKPLISLLYILIATFSPLSAQNGIELKKEIEKAMVYDLVIDTAKMTGWVIGCIDHDSTWVFGYGRTSKLTKTKPDGNTIFEIGGVTKAFTSTVAQMMVEQKILHLDSAINLYLKPTQQFPLGNTLTLLQLMTHTSGLPKLPEAFGMDEKDKNQPYASYTEGMLFDYLKSVDTADLRIGKYNYSHINHAIIEKIIANKGGENSLNNIEKRFDDTSSIFIQGYNPAQLPVANWRFNETFKYSVGIKATMNELLDFMKLQLGIKDTFLFKILRGTQEPLFKTDIDKNTSVGKSWHILKYKKKIMICLQSGSTNGQSTFIAFIPETKTGVVVMANTRLVQAPLGMLVLKILNYNWRRDE